MSTSSVESGPKETGGTNQQPSNAPVQRQWYEWGWGYYYDQYDEWWYGDPWGNERVGIRVRGQIDRKDFGVTWQKLLESGRFLVGDEVKLLVDVSAVKAT